MSDEFTQDPVTWIEDRDHAVQLLTAYLAPGMFTGSLWDSAVERRTGPDACNVIDVEDLYSPTLLSAPIRGSAGQAIIRRAHTITEHLGGIDAGITLWHPNLEKVNDALICAERLVRELRSVPHVGPTRASKLAAAKRPRLIPIWDSQVSGALGAAEMSWLQYWMAWRRAVTRAVEELRAVASQAGRPELSPLRTMDIIIWMDEWGWKDLPTDQWEELKAACRSRHSA